jgi:anti-anti-sigma factor
MGAQVLIEFNRLVYITGKFKNQPQVDKIASRALIIFRMEMERENWQIKSERDWVIVAISGRIDSFNQSHFYGQVKDLVNQGKRRVAIDLTHAKFLSLPSIKWLCSLALELKDQGGQVALLSASEKLKRQIDIYASLEPLQVLRSSADLSSVPQA